MNKSILAVMLAVNNLGLLPKIEEELRWVIPRYHIVPSSAEDVSGVLDQIRGKLDEGSHSIVLAEAQHWFRLIRNESDVDLDKSYPEIVHKYRVLVHELGLSSHNPSAAP